jgi:hypothetical protein
MDVERVGKAREAAGSHARDSVFVLLDLLKSHTGPSAQFTLRQPTCRAPRADKSPDFGVLMVSPRSARPLELHHPHRRRIGDIRAAKAPAFTPISLQSLGSYRYLLPNCFFLKR